MSEAREPELRTVLVIGAHPDDPEFGCAATIAKWAGQGRQIDYLLLTSGDKGSHDPTRRPGQVVAMREEEQRAAARVLGVRSVTFLRHPDGMLENTMALRQQVCGLIRQFKPDILLAIDPWRRYQLHPDHRAAGQVALDAAWAAREWYLFPEQLGDEEPWRIKEVYLYWTDDPNYWEDVTESMDLRIRALTHHASQVGDRMEAIEERVRRMAKEIGEPHGYTYAEALRLIKL
ncbi:MAG: PIG-L deacetylase family protein [Anaerolineae bacterium]|jgi:LmbE family N-acetylglucosaminyl deacetylase